MEPCITARNLCRIHNLGGEQVRALDGVDFTVGRGEFVALMGPSGSGKTTLVNILAGLDLPTSGEVLLGDVRLDQLSENARAMLRRRRIGYVFQFFNLLPALTAEENVALPALLAGAKPREAKASARALLERAGLSHRLRSLPSQLSGGEQQRVAVARALVNAPDLVLADEPTGNLDRAGADSIGSLLRELMRPHQAVVVTTHDARLAARADRVLALRDGRIADEQEPAAAGSSRPTFGLGRLP